MATNIEVTKSGTDNNLSLIRKFTKRVQNSGVLARLREIRYSKRLQSKYVKKKMALKRLEERNRIRNLIKMGKIPGSLV